MDVTELAHWRYRVKAITAEIPQWEQWSRQAQLDAWRDPDILFIQLRDDTNATLECLRWLLEEAKYMCELGQLCQPPHLA